MEPFLKEGKGLLVIAVSSGISTTYQSAMIAAADLREAYPQRVIQVVDSLSGSLGEGLLLWHACRMRDAGETLSNVAAWLKDHCRRICHWVTVNDLSNLKRSGRLSSTGAFVGTMLDIKLIIKVTEEGKDLLVIAVSSGISTTYQSAMIAASDLKEVYPQRAIQVVDSLSGSLGEGLLLWHACRMRDAGESLSNVAAWLRAHCRRICHWVTVNDLSNLKRSGRLSSAGAFVGTMLDIKPIIKVTEEGKLVSNAKVRGRRASIRMLAQKFAQYRSASEEGVVTIAHGDCPEDAEALAELLKNEYGVKHILKGYVGPILGAHTGPGVLGLFHIGTQR